MDEENSNAGARRAQRLAEWRMDDSKPAGGSRIKGDGWLPGSLH